MCSQKQQDQSGGKLTARIAVEKAAYHFDKLYDYDIPPAYAAHAAVGCRVLVPFGAGNRKRQGIILELPELPEDPRRKPIALLLDEGSCLSGEQLELVRYLRDQTFCTYYDAVRTLLPAGLGYRFGITYQAGSVPEAEMDEEAADILRYVRGLDRPAAQERLCAAFGLTPEAAVLRRMVEAGYLVEEDSARRRVGDETVTMARLTGVWEEAVRPTPKQRLVAGFLAEAGSASVREVGYYTGTTAAVVKGMASKGWVEFYENQVFRSPLTAEPAAPEALALTEAQQRAYEGLRALYRTGKAAVSLLYGVTGSGKTSVFLRLIEDVVRDGGGVIVLVPEISLTPQTVGVFTARFGDRVAILHSSLSMGERLDEWRRIREGRVDIAVGTRSAVFAPFERIGLIILDEEQESAYQSEQSPRYHAREVAKQRALRHNAQLLLCSATPSVESYYHAEQGRYHLFTLPQRYGEAVLPPVTMVDMDAERRAGNPGGISAVLAEELEENLRRGQQSILLLNRRGYNTLVKCTGCGTAVTCPNCSIALAYHQANGRLLCHYCGYSRDMAQTCEVCGGSYVRYSGTGTQKLEAELHGLFPSARVLRMDADTTMAKHAYEQAFERFARGEYDVMVGTQMVAKGLNFPGVTLVGVLAADGSLFGDYFRSAERTFSLLTQVVGRCGRGILSGRAYIQTHFPEHPLYALAAAQDYGQFYREEIASRRLMLYPPFCQMCAVGFAGPEEADVVRAAREFFGRLAGTARERCPEMPLRILGPTPGTMARVGGKFRYKLIIKCRNTREYRALLSEALTAFGRESKVKGVTVGVDSYYDGAW